MPVAALFATLYLVAALLHDLLPLLLNVLLLPYCLLPRIRAAHGDCPRACRPRSRRALASSC